MSRGLGQVQRATLDVVTKRGGKENIWNALPFVTMLVEKRLGREFEDLNVRESVRRALRTLEHRGYVETRKMYNESLDGSRINGGWCHGWILHARLSADYFSTLTWE